MGQLSRGGSRQRRFGWLPDLSPDGWLLFAATCVRNFAVSFLAVVLGLYLAALGLEAGVIGSIFSAALFGGAVLTIVLTVIADQIGRRRSLIITSALMALGGLLFGVSGQPWLLASAALIGGINPVGKEMGPFLSIEQAILPQTTTDRHRTSAFAAYNMAGTLSTAVGALVAGLPGLLGLEPLAGYRVLILAYAAAGVLLAILFARLSAAVEAERPADRPWRLIGVHRSRGLVAKLAALLGLDAFAGGFLVQSLVAYWFNLRYGVDAGGLGAIFFGANLLGGLSMVAAAPLARRIGLVNVMVFTHLPANIFTILVPLMPSVELAIATWLARHLFAQLDVPARQSYSMAIVAPDERSSAAGLTLIARSAAASVAPAFAGAALAVPALGLSFFIGGGLKIVYDGLLLAAFRHIRPPEEAARRVKSRIANPPLG